MLIFKDLLTLINTNTRIHVLVSDGFEYSGQAGDVAADISELLNLSVKEIYSSAINKNLLCISLNRMALSKGTLRAASDRFKMDGLSVYDAISNFKLECYCLKIYDSTGVLYDGNSTMYSVHMSTSNINQRQILEIKAAGANIGRIEIRLKDQPIKIRQLLNHLYGHRKVIIRDGKDDVFNGFARCIESENPLLLDYNVENISDLIEKPGYLLIIVKEI